MAQYTDSPKSDSTATFSTVSAPASNIFPSSVIAPNPAHQTTTSGASAAQPGTGDGDSVNRWSEGTFGHGAAASGPASSSASGSAFGGGAGSSSYSGKTEEATTAQAAPTMAKAVTIGKSGTADAGASGATSGAAGNPREMATSADAAGLFEGLSQETLKQIEDSADSVKRRRNRKDNKNT